LHRLQVRTAARRSTARKFRFCCGIAWRRWRWLPAPSLPC